jgi:hypothetical protein
MSIWEAGMMLCFGASWPVSISKALRSKRSDGKSRLFLAIILAGYAMGLVHKCVHDPDWVIALYAFNATLVAIDLALCLHYRRHPGGRPPSAT